MVDGMFNYRDEDQKADVIAEVDVTSEEDGLASDHWIQESKKWSEELEGWQKFKEAQRIHNQLGRSETELELENTDVNLVEVLFKLNDWQQFQFIHQRKVHEAMVYLEQCRKEITKSQNAMVAANGAESTREIQQSTNRWLLQMKRGQERLEASQEKLTWVKGQWTEVLAEAGHSIPATRNLQKQLEDKFEKQTNTIYRHLQQMGARPSRAVHPPDRNAEFPQRLQHWIFESSKFAAELRDWRMFMKWRLYMKNADAANQEGQKQVSQGESCSELFEDLVKYRQYELDKAISWVDCWQCRVRQCTKASESTSPQDRNIFRPVGDEGDEYDESYEDDGDEKGARAYAYGQPDTEAEQAQSYAMQAKEKVSVAAKQLEQSKKELESILAQCDPPSTGEIAAEDSGGQLSPTPPKSQAPGSLSKSRRPSNKRNSAAETSNRRSKKEKTRKGGAKASNTNTKQQALPSLNSNQIETDDDIEMSDVPSPRRFEATGELKTADSEDTVMPDAQYLPKHTPSRKPPSSRAQGPTSRMTRSATKLLSTTSRKTRSATKLLSGRVPKNTDKKPTIKAKAFTEQQTMKLLSSASLHGNSASVHASSASVHASSANIHVPSTHSPPPRRSERLKENAAAPAITSLPQLNAAQPWQSSRQEKPKKQFNPAGPSQPSRQKKPKVEEYTLKTMQTSRRKLPTMKFNAVEPSRQRQPRMQFITVQPSRPSSQNQSKMEFNTLTSSRPSRQEQPKIESNAVERTNPIIKAEEP